VNVMLWLGLPDGEALAAAGVRRISQGGAGFLLAAGFLEQMTTTFLDGTHDGPRGDVSPAAHLIPELASAVTSAASGGSF